MGKSGRIRSRHRAAPYLLRTIPSAPSSSSPISAMSASTMSSSPAMEGHGVSGETSSTSQTTIVEEVIGALVGKQRLAHGGCLPNAEVYLISQQEVCRMIAGPYLLGGSNHGQQLFRGGGQYV